MLHKNELKYIQSLCQKRQRQEERRFLAEGNKLVGEMLDSAYPVYRIYATAEWAERHPGHTAITNVVTEGELERISQLQTPNEVLAIAEQRLPSGKPDLSKDITLVLDGIQDPGNLGTIIRIADWFGISQIIASEDTVEWFNPKVIQSTMGSFLRVQGWYQSLPEVLEQASVPVYGALLSGDDMYALPPLRSGMLVIGNESKGIRPDVLPFISHAVTIPRMGGAESLNAAVATGILLSQFCRPA
jgi:TrmH family RNA methyltransferase